ncbi:MAG: shikimate dehydrogenase [Solirubrobacterales bacterium]|nr:shikimate dehydrogenase [Solirubrobacterales bacterium]MCB8915272.1 shikimate dehydrogenase [Thermoleophilales bacterium]
MNPEPATRLAVLGHPVSHSRSPAMQNAALAAVGLEDWDYEAIDVVPEEFALLVRELPERGFLGANVTVPHKEAALAVADQASEAARAIGAANTLSFSKGLVRAENTDAPGLIDALTDDPGTPAANLTGARALVLGAGGAGRAVVWALAGEGMTVMLWNRTRSKAEDLAARLGVEVIPSDQHGSIDPGPFEVIVNASAAGLGGEDALAHLPLDQGGFRPGQTVVDMVYGEMEGALIAAARQDGARTIDGLEVLVRQGARSFEIWTGMKPDLETMRQAARA